MYFVCFSQNFQKSDSKFFLSQNRKSEQLSINGLIISVPLFTFGVRKRQKFFVKWVKKCTLRPEHPFEFCLSMYSYKTLVRERYALSANIKNWNRIHTKGTAQINPQTKVWYNPMSFNFFLLLIFSVKNPSQN